MNPVEKKVLVVAHRGASGHEPDNTCFLRPDSAQGTDVHLTMSDVAAIIHDDTLEHTTNRTGKVRDRNLNATPKKEDHKPSCWCAL